MNKELLRLINILKSVPEIKELIEELKFGCWFKISNRYAQIVFCKDRKNNKFQKGKGYEMTTLCDGVPDFESQNIDEFKIIGRIHEGHLREFLYGKFYVYFVDGKGMISITKNTNTYKRTYFQLDNTNDLMNQSETFYKKLNDWIEKEFKLEITK